MLVTGVGNDTEFGQIAQELSSIEKTTTPLQEKLDKLGKQITVLGASAAAIVFAIEVIQFVMNGQLKSGHSIRCIYHQYCPDRSGCSGRTSNDRGSFPGIEYYQDVQRKMHWSKK